MSNDTEICCEWKHIAWDDHDRVLQCLITLDQTDYEFLRGSLKRELEQEVLPLDRIAVIDYGSFAEAHTDILTFEALATAHFLSATAKSAIPPSAGPGRMIMVSE